MKTLYGDIKDELEAFFDQNKKWATIDEIIAELDKQDTWGDFIESALKEAKKALVRKLVKQLRTEQGASKVQSIVMHHPDDGKKVHVYKQELFFDLDDYRQCVTYHCSRSAYHERTARELDGRCVQRYRKSVLLPAPPGSTDEGSPPSDA